MKTNITLSQEELFETIRIAHLEGSAWRDNVIEDGVDGAFVEFIKSHHPSLTHLLATG